ncbi:MAG: hypothetical protein IBX50_11600 [Marinospirillum sp.]|uniref:hypothetical protein n=1 Tax=Marinospirillum sp. TaxID=2183934 RepID=UPI001A0847E0|nr:hypothetical protein [Marinospirillum sp.]MBE0507342.1 hypothetical protein [Marinospirillum sp.]
MKLSTYELNQLQSRPETTVQRLNRLRSASNGRLAYSTLYSRLYRNPEATDEFLLRPVEPKSRPPEKPYDRAKRLSACCNLPIETLRSRIRRNPDASDDELMVPLMPRTEATRMAAERSAFVRRNEEGRICCA